MRRLVVSVFLAGAALMGLEIVGSRVLAPVYGTSILVWGALITTFLVSLAAGYALGGRLADRRPRAEVLADVLALSGALLWILCLATPQVLAATERAPVPARFRPLAAALALFAVPSVLMGMATPFAVRLAARDVATVGTSAGRLSSISTAGSILGTFATAFFLIPAFPLQPILYGLGATLVVAALLLVRVSTARFGAFALLLAAGAPAFLLRGGAVSDGPSGKVLLDKETAYHHIRVFEEGRYRVLAFDHLTQGRLPRDPGVEGGLTYPDGLYAALSLRGRPARSAVVIGLGAGMVPRFLSERMPSSDVTTIEIDPEVLSVARRFFDFRTGPRNRVLIGDGRRVLAQEIAAGSLDAVLLDAYFSDSIPFHLLTREFLESARSKLGPDGVFAGNFVGSLCGKGNALFWAAHKTFANVFPRVYVLSPELREGRRPFIGNAILIGTVSRERLDPAEVAARSKAFAEALRRPEIATWGAWLYDGEVFANDVPLLTDDYVPSEALQHLR